MLHHCKIAIDKCRDFSGRDDLIARSIDMILATTDATNTTTAPAVTTDATSTTTTTMNDYKISLCLIGNSGSGKTALMSKLAQVIRVKVTSIPTIIRFCGTSGDSMSGLALIKSISKQMEVVYQLKEVVVSDDYEKAVAYFHSLLASYPVMLFIDSLDQLNDTNQGTTRISFLNPYTLLTLTLTLNLNLLA